jgi:hypothetical protein
VQSQQLLPKCEVLQKEFFSGEKGRNNPAEQMSKAHKNQVIIAKNGPRRFASKSLILRTRRVLARHRPFTSRLILEEPASSWDQSRGFGSLIGSEFLANSRSHVSSQDFDGP